MEEEKLTSEETVQPVQSVQPEEKSAERPVTRRYNRRGNRRGKYAYAAPLGVLITLLAVIGVAALIVTGVKAIRKAQDTTALKEEFYYFLEPLMVYNPKPFDGIAETEQDAFLNAAAYRISLDEQIRMLRENDENCIYAVDDIGRLAVPTSKMETAYDSIVGPESALTHRSLEVTGLTFSAADDCYYIPFNSLNTGYQGVVESVRKKGNTYTVRVGYVANNDVQLDEHGNTIPPTADMATYYQTYTVIRYDGGYYVNACTDE